MKRILVSILLYVLANSGVVRADGIPSWPEWYLPLPALECTYGGAAPIYFETTFDYGFAFREIAYAHLLVIGAVEPNTPLPMDLAFQATLNGVPSAEVIGVWPGSDFDMLAPIVPPLSTGLLLDGHGTIGLRVNQIGTPEFGADVDQVHIVVCGLPVPEPTGIALPLAFLVSCRRRM